MKLRNKLVSSYLVMTLFVIIVGFIGIVSIEQINENSLAGQNMMELIITHNKMENLLSSIVLVTDSNVLENDITKYNEKSESFIDLLIMVKKGNLLDNNIIIDIELENKKFVEISSDIISLQKEKIILQTTFTDNYDVEKLKRYDIRTHLFPLDNSDLTKNVGDIQYYSKETLYQNKDQKTFDEWLGSLYSLKEKILKNEYGLSLEDKDHILTKLDLYEITSQTMGQIAIRQHEINLSQQLKINDLREINDKTEYITQKIISGLELSNQNLSDSIYYVWILILIASISTSLVTGIYISKKISNPIIKLRNAVNKIEKGDMNTSIVINGNDEISELAQTFNVMTKSIRKNIEIEKELLIQREKTKNVRLIAIGEMAARLAHDLRNPLSMISNQLELMKINNPHPDENTEKGHNRISRSIERMSHQLEKVMDFVRVKPLDIKSQSLRDLIKNVVQSFEITSEIKINIPENDCMIDVDSIQMGIVFNNLIFNSIQVIGDSGEINIKILDNTKDIEIEFQDSGSGIPENNLKKIFEPMYTTKQTGTGLGLASCLTIVQQHGGTMLVKNNPTTFTVKIPKIMNKVEK